MRPLQALLAAARAHDYHFITVTPETHRRVLARRTDGAAADLRDVFGWSLPFHRELLPAAIWDSLHGAGMAEQAEGGLWRSRLRISSAAGTLFLHSAYPTTAADSVFFGPDSYRFISFLQAEIPRIGPRRRLVDIGSGSGVGAISAARLLPSTHLTLADINPNALELARVNARFPGLEVERVDAPGLEGVSGEIHLVIVKPPFVMDPCMRAYRDGGDLHGLRLSLNSAEAAMLRLAPGGAMLLYTGSVIVGARDPFNEALAAVAASLGCTCRYAELDPDIFGELLEGPAYHQVERIAAVGAVLVKG